MDFSLMTPGIAKTVVISELKQYAGEKKVWREVTFIWLVGGRKTTVHKSNVKDGITLLMYNWQGVPDYCKLLSG